MNRMGLLDTFKDNMRRMGTNAGRQLLRELASMSNDPKLVINSVFEGHQREFLLKWWPKLTHEDKKELLTKVWTNNMPNAYYGYDWWLPLFEDVGYFSNCGIEKPTEDIVLYRGIEPDPRYIRGMSWTADTDIAELVVEKKDGWPSRIYEAKIKPEYILAVVKSHIINSKGTAHHLFPGYVVDYIKLNLEDIKEWVK